MFEYLFVTAENTSRKMYKKPVRVDSGEENKINEGGCEREIWFLLCTNNNYSKTIF